MSAVKTAKYGASPRNFGGARRVHKGMVVKEAGCANPWASETFGAARLGDQRRTDRLVAMAARAAESPRGTVTGVFPSSAEREEVFRLLESGDVTSDAVGAAPMAQLLGVDAINGPTIQGR
jgi:Transposase DNA-binding